MRRLLLALCLLLVVTSTLEAQTRRRNRWGSHPTPSAPELIIHSPTTLTSIEVSSSALTLAGTCADDTACTAVTWVCTGCQAPTSGTANFANLSWNFDAVLSCSAGAGTANTITVTGSDGTLTGQDILLVTCTVPDTGGIAATITTNGGANFGTTVTPTSLAGTATDDVGISGITVQNTTTGVFATVTLGGTALSRTWSAPVALQEGANAIEVVATDAAANTATDTITVTYTTPLVFTTASALGACVEDVGGCSKTFTITGGTAPITFSEVGSNLGTGNCNGITLTDTSGPTGGVSGMPNPASVPVTCSFTIRATDSAGSPEIEDRAFTINITAAGSETAHSYYEALTDPGGTYADCGGGVTTNCRIQLRDCTGDSLAAGNSGGCSLRSQTLIDAMQDPSPINIASWSSSAGTVTIKTSGAGHDCFVGGKITATGAGSLTGTHIVTGIVGETPLAIASTTGGTLTVTVTTVEDLPATYVTGTIVEIGGLVNSQNKAVTKVNGQRTITVTGARTFTVTADGDNPLLVDASSGSGVVRITSIFEIAGSLGSGSGGTMYCWLLEYDTARDTHVAAVDGVKMSLPPSRASLGDTISFQTPQSTFITSGAFLVVSDVYFTREFRVPECGGNMGGPNPDYKAYMTTGQERYFEFRHSWSKDMRSGEGGSCLIAAQDKVGTLNLRTYAGVSGHNISAAAAWGQTASNNAMTPTGKNALIVHGFQTTVETWTRLILYIEMDVQHDDARLDAWKNSCNTAGGLISSGSGSTVCANIPTGVDPATSETWKFHLYTMWACDEDRDCQRVLYRMPWFPDQDFNELWQLRMNTSAGAFTSLGMLYAYFRNVVALQSPTIDMSGVDSAADVTNNPTLLVRPIR